MTGDVRIRKIDAAEEERARRFFASRYPERRREEAFRKRGERWRWQYFNHPCGEPGILVAELNGNIVGIIGTNAVRIRTPRGVVKAVWAGDLLIDPAIRGKGIGKKLVDAWKESGAVAVGKGFGPIAYSLYVNRGFKGIWGFTRLHIVLSRTRLAMKLLRAGERRNLLRLARTGFGRPERSNEGEGVSISLGDAPPRDMGALWESAMRSYAFAFERDERYIAWRFTAHPFHRYRFIEARRGGQLSGLAVVRITSGRIPTGVVADLIADPRDEETVRALMRGAISHLKSQGACAAVVELPPALTPIVSKAFPRSLREEFALVLHTTDPDLEAKGFYDPAGWYVSLADSDADY